MIVVARTKPGVACPRRWTACMTSAPPTPNSSSKSNSVYGNAPDAATAPSTVVYDPSLSSRTSRRSPSSPISTCTLSTR